MENVGQNTLFWYGTWPEVDADGVRCAVWQRDRLGYLATDTKLKTPASGATVTSCPIKCNASGTVKISLNVQGTGTNSTAKVDLLTEQFAPLPGYSGEDCIVSDGLRSPVLWQTNNPDAPGAVSISGDVYASHLVVLPTEAASGRIRVRVTIAGELKANVRLFAIYCDDPTTVTPELVPDLFVPPSNADELLAAAAAGVSPAGFALDSSDLDGFEEVSHCAPEDQVEQQTTSAASMSLTPATRVPEETGSRHVVGSDMVAKLRELKELFEAEFLTADEFSRAKAALIPQPE